MSAAEPCHPTTWSTEASKESELEKEAAEGDRAAGEPRGRVPNPEQPRPVPQGTRLRRRVLGPVCSPALRAVDSV